MMSGQFRLVCFEKLISLYFILLLLFTAGGCASFSHTNIELKRSYEQTKLKETKATFCVTNDRGKYKDDEVKKALVILSLSGGGSRAAYWSASVMLALEKVFSDVNILEEVDIISSVSGGSLPAAYYAISKDENDLGEVESNRLWEYDTVTKLMKKDYRSKWLWNWFWPHNIFKYWFTAFDRSDIMAQTFADNMFDKMPLGHDLSFDDINPERPYLVINSTNGTEECFSDVFTFTHDDFMKIKSDIGDYDISRAVMASASFPSAFNYMTLKDFNTCDRKYVHVFDAGSADNLGLTSVEKIIDRNKDTYNKIIVILVDANTKSTGVNKKDYDARNFIDYYVDLNFLDSVDTLMSENRWSKITNLNNKLKGLNDGTLEEYKPNVEVGKDRKDRKVCEYNNDREGRKFCEYMKQERLRKDMNGREGKNRRYETIFYHITFDDINDDDNHEDSNLWDRLNAISTDFRINEAGTKAIDKAVNTLIIKDNTCLKTIKDILLGNPTTRDNPYCRWEAKVKAEDGEKKSADDK